MENTTGQEKGKSKVKVVLQPLYVRGDELICSYHFHGELREVYLPAEELKKASSIQGKSILAVEATIEKIFDGMVLCQLDGYYRKLILAEDELEFIG